MAETFESIHKVRSYECDLYGHVNNAVYLNYLEFARMEVLEQKGITLDNLKEAGYLIVIRRIEIEYKFPAVALDRLRIITTMKKVLNSSGIFHQRIIRIDDGKEIVDANVNWVVVSQTGRPVRMPNVLKDAFGI